MKIKKIATVNVEDQNILRTMGKKTLNIKQKNIKKIIDSIDFKVAPFINWIP